jgi:hypothetical protein
MDPAWSLSSRLSYVLWRRVYTSPIARLRAFWHHVVRGYASETCTDCGKRVEVVWLASNELWSEHAGTTKGVLCPGCFDCILERKGIFVRWRPETGI